MQATQPTEPHKVDASKRRSGSDIVPPPPCRLSPLTSSLRLAFVSRRRLDNHPTRTLGEHVLESPSQYRRPGAQRRRRHHKRPRMGFPCRSDDAPSGLACADLLPIARHTHTAPTKRAGRIDCTPCRSLLFGQIGVTRHGGRDADGHEHMDPTPPARGELDRCRDSLGVVGVVLECHENRVVLEIVIHDRFFRPALRHVSRRAYAAGREGRHRAYESASPPSDLRTDPRRHSGRMRQPQGRL